MSDATEIDSARDVIENARGVIASPAFARWKQILEAQVEGRQKQALGKPLNPDDLGEHNYQCGEAAGMLMAIGMWELMIAEAKQTIEQLESSENADDSPAPSAT